MNLSTKAQLMQIDVKPQAKKAQKRKQERLSTSEWKNIMGANMRVHTRVGGRVRQK
ncbi:hypothetical protein [Bacillus sp. FSL K6-3431]|uniref:hypothetical protein n=1 Tax=Bacillus sp. FSL K6-3431 TaxID=2921500 RepID=UPI0030FB5D08